MTTNTPMTSDEKLMVALCYWLSVVCSFVGALIIFLIKKDEPTIKKHALVAILLNLVVAVLYVVVSTVTFGLGMLILWPAALIYFIFLGYKAFQGEDVSVPVISDMVEKNMAV